MQQSVGSLQEVPLQPCSHPLVDTSATKYASKLQLYQEKSDQRQLEKYQWLLKACKGEDAENHQEVRLYYQDKQNRIRQDIETSQRKMRKIYNKTKAYLKLSKRLGQNQIDTCPDGADEESIKGGTANSDELLEESSKGMSISDAKTTRLYLISQRQAATLTKFSAEHFDLIKNQRKQKEIKKALEQSQSKEMQERMQQKLLKSHLEEESVLHGRAEAAAQFAEMHRAKSYRLRDAIVDQQASFCKAKAKELEWNLESN